VVADGFVTDFENNDHPVIRNWLDGWQVNYLESPQRFQQFMKSTGFSAIRYRIFQNTLLILQDGYISSISLPIFTYSGKQ
jgi:hypothetical protein